MAQVAGGTVSGMVADGHSKPISSASVTLTNVATSAVHTGRTDANGLYSVVNLNPGVYTATATADGFSMTVATNVSVSVSSQLQVIYR